MEQILFKVIITGTMPAYNQEHAYDLIEEVMVDAMHSLETQKGTLVVQAGDNIRDVYLNIDLPYSAGQEEIETHYKKFIQEILKNLEETIPKPPLFFDKTDYLKARDIILDRISYWKQIYNKYGYNTPKEMVDTTAKEVARKLVNDYYKDVAKSIVAATVTEVDV